MDWKMYNIRKYIVVLLCALAGFSGSCSLPGWNSNLKDFIETGLSVVYLDTSSYRRASGDIGDDARSGEEVTVFVYLNNPKSLDLVYTLEAGSGLVASGASAPGGTAGADNQRTFVSFTFIPSESAEHGEIPFTLGLRSPSINRDFDPARFSVRCDSPPGIVENLAGGVTSEKKASIGFTLPENYMNADIASVQITYINDSTKVSRTVTEEVSREGTGLTDVPFPALLDSDSGEYVRYFFPSDVDPENPYTFTLALIDESGKVSESESPSVSVAGTEKYLAYDTNAEGEYKNKVGTVGAVFGYYQTTVATISDAASVKYPHHVFLTWNTEEDGTGTTWNPGESFVFPASNTVLYAQWLPLSTATVSLSEPEYEALNFEPAAVSAVRGETLTVTAAASPAEGEVWSWRLDGAAASGGENGSFEWNTSGASLGRHTVYCSVVDGGVTYSGTLTVNIYATSSVGFDGNGNTSGAAPDAIEFAYGEAVSLTAVGGDFGKSGYEFAGWALSPEDGAEGTAEYADGDTTEALESSLTLYASWRNVAPPDVTDAAALAGDGKIALSWTEPDAADLAYIEIKYGSVTLKVGAGSGTASGTGSTVVKLLESGTEYEFTLRAVDREGLASDPVVIRGTAL